MLAAPSLPLPPQELHHRGVPAELAAAALRSVFGEGGMDLAQHVEQLEDEESQQMPLAYAGKQAAPGCADVHLTGGWRLAPMGGQAYCAACGVRLAAAPCADHWAPPSLPPAGQGRSSSC